jgi:hypothetical protein
VKKVDDEHWCSLSRCYPIQIDCVGRIPFMDEIAITATAHQTRIWLFKSGVQGLPGWCESWLCTVSASEWQQNIVPTYSSAQAWIVHMTSSESRLQGHDPFSVHEVRTCMLAAVPLSDGSGPSENLYAAVHRNFPAINQNERRVYPVRSCDGHGRPQRHQRANVKELILADLKNW